MEVVFLGGASGIGASCIAVRTGNLWFLVDAGVRMDTRIDRLPDLAFLQDKSLAAIFITHAHADHIGAIPVVRQSFPKVPIYTSRPTMLLMELMLTDALQVMAKRASSGLEVPLYDEKAVLATLLMLRTLPLMGTTTVPELPDVTIHISRAGHVAGAVSIGFEAPDGSVIVSGDMSITPQRTVPGAALNSLKHADLLILESTYGARLHPNRQSEEARLAQAVAEGIARGGHVLIPAFALGRAQEVLRILYEAQQRGHIPEFPVWVDGLVRGVCAAYVAMPEALTASLGRQIRKGYSPFFAGMIRPVNEPRFRDQILDGSPACIVSSSGMLVGGPSAIYAAQLAPDPDSSILITGYQDEESPGRRLLSLTDGGGGTLDVGGKTVPVRCHFDRYNLSAHADGSELTGMVSALKPKAVALVHGDGEARTELCRRLERMCEVVLPANGESLSTRGRSQRFRDQQAATPDPGLDLSSEQSALSIDENGTEMPVSDREADSPSSEAPHGPLDKQSLPQLWKSVTTNVPEQVVSLRELALAWYGTSADADTENTIRELLAQDQQFFVFHPDAPGMVRVRTAAEVEPLTTSDPAVRNVQPGALLLIQAFGDQVLPALCLDMGNTEIIRALLPAGSGHRTRFPRASVLEVLGPGPGYPATDIDASRRELGDLSKAALQWQRQHPLRKLVAALDPEQEYRIEDVWDIMQVAPDNLAGRLGIALLLNTYPQVIERTTRSIVARGTMPVAGKYRVRTGPEAEQTLNASDPRPDQMLILSIVERHLGTPPDLYRRSVDADTGVVTLSFHFPDVARQQYAAALEAASAEAGVPIEIYSQPHQGVLSDTARSLLPPGLHVLKTSVHLERRTITLRCSGNADADAIQAAQEQFHARTGWHLELDGDALKKTSITPTNAAGSDNAPFLDMNQATALIKATLGPESGCYKISTDQANRTLQVRFYFPDIARMRYADTLKDLEARSGWQIIIYPEPHQGEMEIVVRRVLPPDLQLIGAPSIHRGEQQIVARCRGSADRQAIAAAESAFAEQTGWELIIQIE